MKPIALFALPSEVRDIDGARVVTATQLFLLYSDGSVRSRFSGDPEGELTKIPLELASTKRQGRRSTGTRRK